MENASKALIMAGGVLIALIILGALILMFNSLSAYQDSTDENLKEAQIVEFNSQYSTYDRNDVRGSDLYSLLNRAVDYNERKSYKGTVGKEISYEPIEIKFTLNNKQELLSYDDANILFKSSEYSENSNVSQFEDTIVKKIESIEKKCGKTKIQNLVLNITTVLDSDNKEKALAKYKEITGETATSIDDYASDVKSYYEFIQFKRAHFNCVKTEYNKHTGRIVKMEFEFKGKFE